MKLKIPLTALLVGLLFTTVSFSQPSPGKVPKWVSERGYWIVESNINNKLNHVIWFYNNDDVLIYKELVTGAKLNPSKRKVRLKLKNVLERVVLAYDRKEGISFPVENGLVSTLLRGS